MEDKAVRTLFSPLEKGRAGRGFSSLISKKGPFLALAAALFWPAPAAANPTLVPGVWTDITPSGVNMAPGCCTQRGYVGSLFVEQGFEGNTFGFLGIEFDPSNPSTLYAAIDVEGLWKSTDGGSNWVQMGDPTNWGYTSTHYLDSPSLVRVDPNNPQRLYATQGVRGATLGFWVSNDGGNTWAQPQSFIDGSRTTWTNDLYWVATDPLDFNHILLTFHSPWQNRSDSGVLEGQYNPGTGNWTWTPHFPPAGSSWGAGLAVNFLFHPEVPASNPDIRGSTSTWLVGTQSGGGYWRTEDAGATWTNVTQQPMMHGGCSVYFTTKGGGVLYSGALHQMMRSTDNGKTWTLVGPSTRDGYYAVIGDGNHLYAQESNTGAHSTDPAPNSPPVYKRFLVSAEDDGVNWTEYDSHDFLAGPYTMKLDAANGIIYAASWRSGILALKFLPSGQTPPPPPAAPSGLAASSPSAGRVNLSWTDNSSDEEGFAVERSNNGGASFASAGTVGAGATSFSETGLPGGSYVYRVRSYKNGQGLMSQPSNTASVAVSGGTQPLPPAAPGALTASSPSAGRALLSWTDNSSDEEAFSVERSNDGGSVFSQAGTAPANATGFLDQGLPAGTYVYRVRAAKAAFSLVSGPSNTATVAVAGGSAPPPQPQGGGASALKSEAPVLLSPGVRDGFNDALSFASGDQEVTVVDAHGRRVYHAEGGVRSWDGKDSSGRPLSPGMYLAKVKDGAGKVRYQPVLIAQ